MTDSTKLSDYPKTETVAKRQEWTTAELQVEFRRRGVLNGYGGRGSEVGRCPGEYDVRSLTPYLLRFQTCLT
jgi:hypothetical protein